MGHRQLSNTNPLPEADHGEVWNHSRPPNPFHTARNSSVIPMENIAVCGSTTMPCLNSTIGSNEHLPCCSSNIRPHNNVAGFSNNSYHLRSAAECSARFSVNYSHNGVPSYIHKTNFGDEYGSLDPLEGSGGWHSKARKPAKGMTYDSANINGYYPGRISSDVPSSSEHFHQMPASCSQVQPWDPVAMNSNYKGKRLLTIEEGSQRYVRPRYLNGVQFDHNQGGTSCNPLDHFHLSRGNPAPFTPGQQNCNTVSVPSNQGVVPSVHGVDQPGGSSNGRFAETDGKCHHSHIISENFNASPIVPCVGRVEVNNNYGPSTNQSHRFRPNHPPSKIASTSCHENGWLGTEGSFRHSVPLPASGAHSRERHVRMRRSYGRSQPYPALDDARRRWMPEVVVSIHQSNFHDDRSLYDQHRDMRLDIDNMSYEELLALEERIGHVNTGLSDDMISKCVSKITYCSQDEVLEPEDGNCVICLETFKDREELGFLKCAHGYHVSCIKQWLQIKNACPICKSSALEK